MTALLVQKAMNLSSWAHANQVYVPGKSYFTHCQEVAVLAAKLARNWNMDQDLAMAVAWLHDTVEDTDVTVTKIASEISWEVAQVVEVLTRDKDKEDYFEDYLPRVGANRMARLVKLADMRCNLDNIAPPGTNRTARDNRLWNKYIKGLEVLAQYMGVPKRVDIS